MGLKYLKQSSQYFKSWIGHHNRLYLITVTLYAIQYTVLLSVLRVLTSTKAAAAERANKTIKTMMYKYFTANNKWIDVLSHIAANYNANYDRCKKSKCLV